MRSAVYPGTFDPITLGHLDIIRRGAHLVDRLVIGVTTNPSKEPMFTVAERMAMVRREIGGVGGNIEVVEFDSLLMDFAERRAILLGLTRLSLYTNEVMTENQAIYTHLGYREVGRHAQDGYRRVYMEKLLVSRP